MKRPISHFIVPIACLLMLPFCLQPGNALGADQTRNHTGGRFQMDLNGNDKGWVNSVEGGSTSTETVNEKLGPVPKQQAIAPARNIAPVTQRTPQLAKPLCPNPPCGLGQQQRPAETSAEELRAKQDAIQDQKDSQSETAEEQSMRLQQYQERRAKAQETLSNTMKKQSDTQSTITGNMK